MVKTVFAPGFHRRVISIGVISMEVQFDSADARSSTFPRGFPIAQSHRTMLGCLDFAGAKLPSLSRQCCLPQTARLLRADLVVPLGLELPLPGGTT